MKKYDTGRKVKKLRSMKVADFFQIPAKNSKTEIQSDACQRKINQLNVSTKIPPS
jgi:hypothetical protein